MRHPRPLSDGAEEAVRQLLDSIGEDTDRAALVETPRRVASSLRFLTQGIEQDPEAMLREALFDSDADEMVVVKDMEFYSLCEHHLLPFYGRCHVAYVPAGKIVGLSKLGRVVDVFSRRLQVQEKLTMQIAEAINGAVQPKGVGVVMEAHHLCMMMRGVQKQGSLAATSCMLGLFKKDARTRAEFLNLIRSDAG
ncbi:MAG TPA: GTP cyclohydrolase I FolE [Candidatus Solibacter sp.]|jgi:GTP cyclohydrolase I|nr:GTP cyclohydrolase I FolE [Candidatus Solibacter sp.]